MEGGNRKTINWPSSWLTDPPCFTHCRDRSVTLHQVVVKGRTPYDAYKHRERCVGVSFRRHKVSNPRLKNSTWRM